MKRHQWNNGDACTACGIHREGAGHGPYGAMRYYRTAAGQARDAGNYMLSPGPCPNNMICSCGSRQTTVCYSPYYRGLMFGCERGRSCRSDDEGMYDTEKDAFTAIAFYRTNYGLDVVPAGQLDPTELKEATR